MFSSERSPCWRAIVCLLLAGCIDTGDPSPSPAVDDEAERPERPNFLIIDIDSMRADRLLLEREGQPIAPTMVSLAERGVLFEQHVVQSG